MGRNHGAKWRRRVPVPQITSKVSILNNSISETKPVTGFSRFELGPNLQKGIVAAGFGDPWAIQEETIPAVLEGRDVLGIAETGTGKTAAFALPILEKLLAKRSKGIKALRRK